MTSFSFVLATPSPSADIGLEEETDLAGRAVSYSLWMYQGDQPQFQALLRAIVDAAQPFESVTWDVYEGIRIDTAVGAQLDILGRIVGEPRGEKTDAEYRPFIRAKIKTNRSHGQAGDLYEILDLIGVETSAIWDTPPAAYTVSVTGCDYPLDTFRFMGIAKPGGVRLDFVYSTYDLDETFQASGTYATEEYDADTGAGSVYDASTGGRSAGTFT